MVDPADFQMPAPRRDMKNPRQGEPIWHQLPAVQQSVSRGPGRMDTITVADARLYLDDLTNQSSTQPHD